MWMFLGILVAFLITRMVTRLIRSGSGGGAGLGNVTIAGNHIHHQVFGILIIIGTGIILVSQTPWGAALDAAAAVFGMGVGLTVDEFALWLHLKDVYWAKQGRQSVDAIFCVLVTTGALIGGASFVTGAVGTAEWWSSMAAIGITLVLCVICLLKGKVVTGVIGIVIGVVALVGAIRLAKPGSWWAVRRYASRPRRASRAARRFDQRRLERWNWLRDFVAGAPSQEDQADATDSPPTADLPPMGARRERPPGRPPGGPPAAGQAQPQRARTVRLTLFVCCAGGGPAAPGVWPRDPTPGHVSFNNGVGGLLNNRLLEQEGAQWMQGDTDTHHNGAAALCIGACAGRATGRFSSSARHGAKDCGSPGSC
jgi:hypothetical protein